MTHERKPVVEAGNPKPQTLRKTSNLLALAVHAYREGDLDTAFDLFIEGMESNLRDGETASTNPDFAALIEEALSEARSRYEDLPLEADLSSNDDDEDDDLLVGSDLSDGFDEDEGLLDDNSDDETVTANLESL